MASAATLQPPPPKELEKLQELLRSDHARRELDSGPLEPPAADGHFLVNVSYQIRDAFPVRPTRDQWCTTSPVIMVFLTWDYYNFA